MNIKRQIVPQSVAKARTYSGQNSLKYIVIHETANESKGTGAQTHANLQSNGFTASWHYQVDEHGAIQSFEDTAQTWHAGSVSYNKASIGIEMCVNSDGDYKKTVDNTIELVNHLMKKHKISVSNVIPHQKTSTWNKECPRYLLRGRYINWNTFIKRLGGESNVSVSKPSKKPVSKPKPNIKTGSIVDYLVSIGQDSSYTNRKRLAVRHGIKNYSGKGSQNVELLNKLKGGSAPKSSKPKVTGSVVNYMESKGMDSSYSNRKKLASKYGISGYKGTSSQNNTLLSKLQGGKTSKKATASSSLPTGVLRQGDRGNDVRKLQKALNKAKFKVGAEDGIYGAKVADGVRRLQKVHDPYRVDGIYGERTRSRLQKLI